ncbi:MAG: endonuclease III [Candidatus Omnitrophica bacterium]|nr:endonuclease III [Candidatus Omnitrophota bacterium]
MLNRNIQQILLELKKQYPKAKTVLTFSNAIEILVATILSAQCTDNQVNKVTQKLFKRYKKVEDYARADIKQFEQEIRSTGFYRNKARNIILAAKKIISDFDGEVPNTMSDLVSLPGVARKTANIVLINAFGKVEGIPVDTHVRRLSQRLAFSTFDDPVKIEQDLMKQVPQKDWGMVSYWIIEHGRAVCQARKPHCEECAVGKYCPSYKNVQKKGT